VLRERAEGGPEQRVPARRGDSQGKLHGSRTKLRDVGAALHERAVRRGDPVLAEREEKVRCVGLSGSGPRGKFARALDHPGHGVAGVVSHHARRLQQDLGVEAALMEKVGGTSGAGCDGREEVAGGRSFRAPFGEPVRELA
jgi:hypothetical protein